MSTSANERAQLATSSISQAEIEARISGHLDELLELWWAEQGATVAYPPTRQGQREPLQS